MNQISPTQIWIIVGAVMLIAELFSSSLMFIFLSIGGFATALLTFLGITDSATTQLLVFSAVSVGSMFVLRKPLKALMQINGQDIGYTEYIGDKATVVQDIPARGEGKVFFRGSEWIALSEEEQPIEANTSVKIQRLDGIKLVVSKLD